MSSNVRMDAVGRVLVITLDRPEARNALDSDLTSAAIAALERLDADDSLAVGILTGERGFCAGMDLKAFASDGPPRGLDRLLGGVTAKPVVAAVERFALAGGLELALSTDLIVAGRTAKLGIPEVTVGLFAAGGGLLRLPRAIPQRIAMELALTGDIVTAAKAHEWGLVNRIVDDGCALEAAIELANRIAANAPLGIAASKRLIHASLDMPADDFWRLQSPMFAAVSRSADAAEGARAFAEKRSPNWKGN